MIHSLERVSAIILLAALWLFACSAPSPNHASTASPSPVPSPTAPPSPTHTPTPRPTPTATSTLTPTPRPTSSPTLIHTPTTVPTPSPTPTPQPESFAYGRSAGGRDLIAWRFGGGSVTVALIGGLHGGLEWNTTELAESLHETLLSDPELVLDGVQLLLIPVANPDGAAAGVGLAGRFNAHGADLDEAWEAAPQHWPRHGPQVPELGPGPFLQPETAALHQLLTAEKARAAAFLHSFDALCLHGGIFPGPGNASASLAATLSQATGYPLSPSGADWPAEGRSTEWLANHGIAAADVHLPSRFQLDRQANLAGLKALLAWVAEPQATPPLPMPASTPAPSRTAPSPIYGDLAAGYPLSVEGSRFTLHYQPGTPADGDTDYLLALTERALAHVNGMLNVDPTWHFDLYVAGTPFSEPGETSRGFSMSSARKIFYLYDGTGTLLEFEGGLAHELTHLTALNEFQPASSTMISEGLAVYVQWPVFERADWLSLDGFCAGMQGADAMPSAQFLLSEKARYWGYLDQDNYMASGCFVAFLIENWSVEAVAQLYNSANWQGVTGHSLAELDAQWAEAMAALAQDHPVDGASLVALEAEMSHAYAYQAAHLDQVRNQPPGWALDGLRVTWRMGRFNKGHAYADAFRAHTSENGSGGSK